MRTIVRNTTVAIVCLMFLSGCSGWKWWAVKQVASETAEDVAEATHLSKTKEELHADIKELKKELNEVKAEKTKLEVRVKELEATCPKAVTEQLTK